MNIISKRNEALFIVFLGNRISHKSTKSCQDKKLRFYEFFMSSAPKKKERPIASLLKFLDKKIPRSKWTMFRQLSTASTSKIPLVLFQNKCCLSKTKKNRWVFISVPGLENQNDVNLKVIIKQTLCSNPK